MVGSQERVESGRRSEQRNAATIADAPAASRAAILLHFHLSTAGKHA